MKRGVPWTRDQKIGLGSLFVGFVGLFIAFLFPEVRVWLHLEKPVAAPAAVSTLEPPKPVVPSSQPTAEPKPKAVQQPKANVNGNNVAGSHNALVGGLTQQGQNNIAQIGGSNNQAVINAVPPERVLTDKQASAVAGVFAKLPSSVKVIVKTPDGNSEAQRYAQQFQEIAIQSGKSGNPVVVLGLLWRPIPVGLHIVSHSEDDTAAVYGDALVRTLLSAEVASEANIADWVPAGQLFIVVGVQR